MNLSPRIKRPLVFLLVGCGWLSVLGNSPGSDFHKVPLGPSSGPVKITLGDAGFIFSAKVRRTTDRLKGGALIEEVTCADGSDCLSVLFSPSSSNGCFSMEPDTRPMGPKDAPGDRIGDSTSDGNQDTTADVTDDATADGPGDVSGDAPGDSASDVKLAASPPATSPAGKADEGQGRRWSCTFSDGRVVLLISRSETGRTLNVGSVHEIVVETAAGTRSTLEYTIEEEKPEGYFGC